MADPRSIRTGIQARKKILEGAVKLTKTVGVTYGPGGRTVMMQRFAGLLATKDGVTVAQEIHLQDREENLGAQIIKEACVRVNKEVGDGTTSTAILAEGIMQEGHKMIVAGVHPGDLIAGIQEASREAIKAVRRHSLPVESKEDLYRIAFISCNGDEEIAGHLAEASMAVGRDGTITITDGFNTETCLEFKEGMEISSGTSDIFRDFQPKKTLEGALVAVINAPLHTVPDVVPMLEEATQWPNPLVIIAPRIEEGAFTTFMMNHMLDSRKRDRVKEMCPLVAPGMPQQKFELLKDIAALTKATIVDPNAGMNHTQWNPEWFGTVRRITFTADTTVLEAYPEAHETVRSRLEELRKQKGHLSGFELDQLQERMGKLSGGVAVLRVGGETESAMKERRARIEDALGSVRASLRGGMVPGAGSAYLLAAASLSDRSDFPNTDYGSGWKLLAKVLQKPVRTLIQNAGYDPECAHTLYSDIQNALSQHSSTWMGWDILQNQKRNLIQDPLIADPTDVVVSAIESAVSVASLLLTAEASITKQEGVLDEE